MKISHESTLGQVNRSAYFKEIQVRKIIKLSYTSHFALFLAIDESIFYIMWNQSSINSSIRAPRAFGAAVIAILVSQVKTRFSNWPLF